jgi:hypothetical protein
MSWGILSLSQRAKASFAIPMISAHPIGVRRIAALAIATGLIVTVTLYLRHSSLPIRHPASSIESEAGEEQSLAQDSLITRSARIVLPTPIANSPTVSSKTEKASLPQLFDVIGAIKSETDPERRGALMQQLLESVSEDQFEPLITHLLATGESQDLQADLLRRWTESSPMKAANWATSLDSDDQRETALKAVAAAWAEQDLPSSLLWLERLPTGPQRDLIAGAISYEAARSNPLAALKLATELPTGQSRDDLVGRAIREWSATEPAAAADWSLGITDTNLRQKSIAEIAVAWASKDPSSAATFATTHLPPNDTLSRVAVEIIQQWAASAPANAAAWANSFPDGDLRNTALHQIISTWADSSPNEITSWINQQPPGDVKNRSYAEYSEALASSNPAGAIPIAEQIANDNLRQEKLEIIASRWLDADSHAARSWISSSQLSQAAKDRLLGHSDPNPPKP